MTTSRIWISAILLLALAACNGQNLPNTLPTSLPSNVPALIRPSGTPTASPAPGAAVATNPVTATAPATTTTPGQGEIKVVGADLFNKYTVNYRTGMKWVYSLKMPGFSLPSLPAIPGFTTTQLPSNLSDLLNIGSGGTSGGTSGGSSNSNGELGEMTMEVTAVQGDLVTMATAVKMNFNLPGGAPFKPTETTFSKAEPQKLYSVLAQSGNTNGTYTYSLIAAESVTVTAGSYNADKISGKLQATSSTGAGDVSSQQDSLLWMANQVGMVKQETKTVTAGISSTTVLELKSFAP